MIDVSTPTCLRHPVTEDGAGEYWEPAGSRSWPGVASGLMAFARECAGGLPHPGGGGTGGRFRTLSRWAARDLSLGRLVEGHADALSILAEAGTAPYGGQPTYGVWAARARSDSVTATPVRGGWRLSGSKPYCSGSTGLDRALVTVESPEGTRLFDLSVGDQVVDVVADSWPAIGMAASHSETLVFGGRVIAHSAEVGGPGFYTQRPGFWFGGTGVAACWLGGAQGLVSSLTDFLGTSPSDHALADLGRAVALVDGMTAMLGRAADEIDADPEDVKGGARRRALAVRQLVHDSCVEVQSLVTRAGGAGPLCHDPVQARRSADLTVYLAQHHGGVDAALLGRLAIEDRA